MHFTLAIEERAFDPFSSPKDGFGALSAQRKTVANVAGQLFLQRNALESSSNLTQQLFLLAVLGPASNAAAAANRGHRRGDCFF